MYVQFSWIFFIYLVGLYLVKPAFFVGLIKLDIVIDVFIFILHHMDNKTDLTMQIGTIE